MNAVFSVYISDCNFLHFKYWSIEGEHNNDRMIQEEDFSEIFVSIRIWHVVGVY